MPRMDTPALLQAVADLLNAAKALAAQAERVAHLLNSQLETAPDAPTSTAGRCPYDDIVKEWNSRCAAVGMKARIRVGELRARILTRWKQHPHLDIWRSAMDACARDDWWRGKSGTWKGNLESFLIPKHFDRFLDEALARNPAPDEASSGPLFDHLPPLQGGAPIESAQAVLDRILQDPAEPLPQGFPGMDPRGAPAGSPEHARRCLELLEYLRSDWRFDQD